jgi:hypothetical protein
MVGWNRRKKKRLEGLCKELGLSIDETKPLRYQLLHRTASAILEAKRYRASLAAVLVHSFSDDKIGFTDFSSFLQVLGITDPTPGSLVGPVTMDGVSLYAGWVQDKAPKAESPLSYLDALRSYAERHIREYKKFRAWCDERSSKLKSRTE